MDIAWLGGPGADVLVGTLVALTMLVGLAGIVIPVLPGLGLICAATLVWALYDSSVQGWVAFGIALVLWACAFVLQYYIPGRRLQAAGVPTWVLLVSGLAGIVGFFVIPVLGLPLFFVGSVFLLESTRQGKRPGDSSLRSTWQALIAVGLAQLIELTFAMLVVVTWVLSLLVSAFR